MRTLPLSVSGILVGTALANLEYIENRQLLLLSLLTTIAFQITSNFANDYGDGVKGTDSSDRIGPKRALQSGILTKSELFRGIVITCLISLGLTIVLVYKAFGLERLPYILVFLILGLFSIWAALKYTMGKSPYGYQGLGDVFVFLFFGIVAVLGSKFLYTYALNFWDSLPAIGIGLLCVGVLNLNNLRDVVSDKNHNKNTLVVKMGFDRGKKYHYSLLIVAFLCFLSYTIIVFKNWVGVIYMAMFLPVIAHLFIVVKTKSPERLDPELKKLALSTFAIALCFYLTINYFL